MRPLRLRLKNFTAFREDQELDFEGLDLFALCGPIGSGKSSILDAITYALYGRVERVGDEPKYLVSQGQPRMAVTFDFRVGQIEARVTRTTQATGISKVVLERRVGGEFQSFGDGADQIRTANKTIVGLIGLDYDAFTRSVVLPQGKFARFLVGDPLTRRRILTELLGLELFEMMAKRSNEISGEAKISADTIGAMLERAYAGVTPAELARARAGAADAAARALALEKAWEALSDLAEADRETQLSIDAIDGCAASLSHLKSTYEEHANALNDITTQLETIDEHVAAAKIDLEKAGDALEGTRADLHKAEKNWGQRDDLVALRERIARLVDAVSEADSCAESLAAAQLELDIAEKQQAASKKALARARSKAKKAAGAVAGKKTLHAAAHRDDLVGALTSDLAPGDPCPVCERPLRAVPGIDAGALHAAAAALELAEKEHRVAEKEVAEAEIAYALATKGVETAVASRDRSNAEEVRRSDRARQLTDEVKAAFQGTLPANPADEVERRLEEMDALTGAVAEAEAGHKSALDAIRELEAGAADARSQIDRRRAAMEQLDVSATIKGSVDRVGITAVPGPFTRPVPSQPSQLEAYAYAVADAIGGLATDLSARRSDLEQERTSLLGRAQTLLPDDATSSASIADAVRSAALLLRTARDAQTRLDVVATTLKDELATKRQLEADARANRSEQQLYKTLGHELQKNRIVDYLQVEALEALATAASARLHELSGGRYVLAFENEGFFVVDGWNGEERRRVNTLSGGETFLASLALALALSEQVQLLAVTEQQRLESLFLDEGFGSLDAETLEVVVAAIEQLGGEDRLVGVITHVSEVADRLPSRIEVVKSPRGSTLVTSPMPS
jgi:DNA repair protein SbcC/Rad50